MGAAIASWPPLRSPRRQGLCLCFFSPPLPVAAAPAPLLVGREAEVTQLHGYLARALRGERQVVFVSGEAGMGKTTTVDAFLASLAADTSLWVARGQCIDHYGSGEAYLPVLDALGRLCRVSGSG